MLNNRAFLAASAQSLPSPDRLPAHLEAVVVEVRRGVEPQPHALLVSADALRVPVGLQQHLARHVRAQQLKVHLVVEVIVRPRHVPLGVKLRGRG